MRKGGEGGGQIELIEYIKMIILPREMGGPCRPSKLRQIVIETAIVLAVDLNCAKSSSKPQLSSLPIAIVPNLSRRGGVGRHGWLLLLLRRWILRSCAHRDNIFSRRN